MYDIVFWCFSTLWGKALCRLLFVRPDFKAFILPLSFTITHSSSSHPELSLHRNSCWDDLKTCDSLCCPQRLNVLPRIKHRSLQKLYFQLAPNSLIRRVNWGHTLPNRLNLFHFMPRLNVGYLLNIGLKHKTPNHMMRSETCWLWVSTLELSCWPLTSLCWKPKIKKSWSFSNRLSC